MQFACLILFNWTTFIMIYQYNMVQRWFNFDIILLFLLEKLETMRKQKNATRQQSN